MNMNHEVMLCVVQQSCGMCVDIEPIKGKYLKCKKCGVREHVFAKDNVVEQFMQYLDNIPKKFRPITIIAHNAQKYDSHYILRYMYSYTECWNLTENSLTINGTKILQIHVGRYRFIDSLNFFNVALAKLKT